MLCNKLHLLIYTWVYITIVEIIELVQIYEINLSSRLHCILSPFTILRMFMRCNLILVVSLFRIYPNLTSSDSIMGKEEYPKRTHTCVRHCSDIRIFRISEWSSVQFNDNLKVMIHIFYLMHKNYEFNGRSNLRDKVKRLQ